MEKKDLRIIFMGTPEFAVATLQSLLDNDYNVVAVVTQPDKPVGRHANVLQPSPVKKLALANGLPVLQPEKMKDEVFLQQLRDYSADIQVVVAFRMLPEVVWSMPRFGTFNVHAALLPQYRGAAPINWAVINGETETGVTTFFLDHDIDTGRIILQHKMPIPDDADVEYVYDGLMNLGANAAIETLERIVENDGFIESMPQEQFIADETKLNQAPKIFKDTCRIDWNQTSKNIYDFIRGLSPYPGSWTTLYEIDNSNKTQVLKIFKGLKTTRPSTSKAGSLVVDKNHLYVNTADCQLELIEIQLSGKKRMSARDFLNGFKNIETYELQ
jgi:methionyl-tRNA formyltransferase